MLNTKKTSLFLIFKDCVYNENNDYNNSLYICSWIGTIEEGNIRKNRQKSYCCEILENEKKKINNYLLGTKYIRQDNYTDVELYEKYINDNNIDFSSDTPLNYFTNEDIIRLSRAQLDLLYKDNYGTAVLYYPIKDKWNYVVEKFKENNLNVLSEYDLDFSGNLEGFENLIHDIYDDYDRNENGLIGRKINLLISSKLKVRIVVLNELKRTDDFYERLVSVKLQMRDILTYTSDKNAFLNVHTPEDKLEAEHLKMIVASINNLWYIRNRVYNIQENMFIKRVEEIKRAVHDTENNIWDYVVVSSGVMEAVGFWKSNDIDIVSYKDSMDINGGHVLNRQYNIFRKSKTNKTNDALIFDDNNYFYCYGMKFCDLEFVKQRYSLYSYKDPKSREKVNAIDTYYDFIYYIDDKKILNDEIQSELRRRENDKKGIVVRAVNKLKREIKRLRSK